MDNDKKYRLLTRSNFDGLICAVLLREVGIIDEIKFVHPKDVQDGKVEVTSDDILASLPYNSNAYLVFDHHSSELLRNNIESDNYIIEPAAPSSARVIYEYFGGQERFARRLDEVMDAVDRADCTTFTKDDILDPKGWVLLNYLMDPRTGLGRHKEFRISNYNLMMDLVKYCATLDVKEIFRNEDIVERVNYYFKEENAFKKQLKECSKIQGNIAVINLKNQEQVYPGNRFMIYALYPKCNISIHCMWGLNKQNTVFAVGKSILNRSSKVDVGSLMYEYGGGGHTNAGTCQVENEKADEILQEIITKIEELERQN